MFFKSTNLLAVYSASIILLLLLCINSSASFRAQSTDTSYKFQIQPLPSLFYTPETRLGLGTSLYTYFRINKKDSLCKKSNSQTYISASINKQFSFENDYQLWLNKNKISLTGSIDYSMFPELFFGIGNETNVMDQRSITFDLIKIKTKSFYRIYKKIYLGLLIHYQRLYNLDLDIMPKAMANEIYGTMGYNSKGIGPILMIDNRDNILNPAKGSYLEIAYTNFENSLNRSHKFTSLSFDLRKYATFSHRLIWNANLHGEFTNGMVPFRMLPEIGGARFLRGYYRGRFRDNHLIVLQQEFRKHVFKRFGVAIFGGLGLVAHELSEFKQNTKHYNYGLGLRININKKENANLRIDYGFTKDSKGLYIVFAEAF